MPHGAPRAPVQVVIGVQQAPVKQTSGGMQFVWGMMHDCWVGVLPGQLFWSVRVCVPAQPAAQVGVQLRFVHCDHAVQFGVQQLPLPSHVPVVHGQPAVLFENRQTFPTHLSPVHSLLSLQSESCEHPPAVQFQTNSLRL